MPSRTLAPSSPTSLLAVQLKFSPLSPITSRLPWEKARQEAMETQSLRVEGAKLYRTLGVR